MMQDADNGVCTHHTDMCKSINETLTIIKELRDKLLGTLDKKGMITEHVEMYEYFLANKQEKKTLVQNMASYVLIALLGGLGALLIAGLRSMI